MFFNDDVNGIQQALQIPLPNKRCSQVRHDKIAHEQNALIRQVDKHRIVSFPSLHRNQFDSSPPDLQFSATIDCDVRFEAAYIVEVEVFAEELFIEYARLIHVVSNLFLIIAPRIETQVRIQSAEIGVTANMVPVRVSDEDGGQFRQARGKGA